MKKILSSKKKLEKKFLKKLLEKKNFGKKKIL